MIKYNKYNIGQSVSIQRYNPWIGDYEISGVICEFENYYMNGKAVYRVYTDQEGLLRNIQEENIKKEVK
jgi:hypothetical protein